VIREYAYIAVLLASFAGGYATHRYIANAEATQTALEQSETNRESERLASSAQARITDKLTADRISTERQSRAMSDRLRKLADKTPAPAGCASRNDDSRPAAGVLSDATRENLERLAREADEVNDRLAACQRRLDL
jgi:hypothetical protein